MRRLRVLIELMGLGGSVRSGSMTYLATLIVVYMTQMETQAELTVQAAGYEQMTATCLPWGNCDWVARSKTTGAWEQGLISCGLFTLDCTVARP